MARGKKNRGSRKGQRPHGKPGGPGGKLTGKVKKGRRH